MRGVENDGKEEGVVLDHQARAILRPEFKALSLPTWDDYLAPAL